MDRQKLMIGVLVAAVLLLGGLSLFLLGRQSAETPAQNVQPTDDSVATLAESPEAATIEEDDAPGVVASVSMMRRVGDCMNTKVKTRSLYFEDMPDAGYVFEFENGLYNMVRDPEASVAAAMRETRAGDPIRLCVKYLPPANCPPGDDRGWVYEATNLRTGGAWTGADDPHSCGGA